MLNHRTRRLRETNRPNHVVGQAGSGGKVRNEGRIAWPELDEQINPKNRVKRLQILDAGTRAITPASPRFSPGVHGRRYAQTSQSRICSQRGREDNALPIGRRARPRVAVSAVSPKGRIDVRSNRASLACEPRRGSAAYRNGSSQAMGRRSRGS